MELSGTVVPMATPTRGTDRTVDVDTLRQFTERLTETGVSGLFPASSIGEFPSLEPSAARRVVRTVTEATGESTAVLAGCCGTSVDTVVANVESAAAAGADAAVVVSPYYLGTTQPGLERFFTAVAEEATLPFLLYNIPGLTGHQLEVDLVQSLATHENVIGLKDTSGDLTYHHRVIEATPPEFAVFQGATEMAAASLGVGADGIIAGPANVFPAAMAALYEAHATGDRRTAEQLTRDVVLPVVTAYRDIPTAAAVKHLLKRDGLDVGEPLPPLPTLSAAERERLDDCYATVSARLQETPPAE
ncbi:MAG: dihydrodipicolinate synthase family protein [Halobaculum sp.]|jgi:4-hydroxy-tetrahydrodipicolinate synthase